MSKINKSELMRKAWESFKFFTSKGKTVSFGDMLKRAWSFAKAALKPAVIDLSAFTKGS